MSSTSRISHSRFSTHAAHSSGEGASAGGTIVAACMAVAVVLLMILAAAFNPYRPDPVQGSGGGREESRPAPQFPDEYFPDRYPAPTGTPEPLPPTF